MDELLHQVLTALRGMWRRRWVGLTGSVVFKVNGQVSGQYNSYSMQDGDEMEIDVG